MGRPKTNILATTKPHWKAGKGGLRLRAAISKAHHIGWKNSYRDKGRLLSTELARNGDSDWHLAQAAEIASIIAGARAPKKRSYQKKSGEIKLAFDIESLEFLWFVRRQVETNWNDRRGRRPNPDDIFKTAISAATARRLKMPSGGHWTIAPTPREIAQTWLMIFGEAPPLEGIRSRIGILTELCQAFELDANLADRGIRATWFPRLGRALDEKRKRSRRKRMA